MAATTAQAAEPKSAVLAPIHQFRDSFNKGDVAAAKATHAADPSILDEVPPHLWRGSGAFDAWAADLGKASKAAGMTDESVTVGKPLRVDVDGDAAYVVMPAAFNYRQKGKRMTEPGADGVRSAPGGGGVEDQRLELGRRRAARRRGGRGEACACPAAKPSTGSAPKP